MRIAIIAQPYVPIPPNQYGGTEQVIHYLIKGLKEAGHEPILLGTGDSEVDCELIPIVDRALFFPKLTKDIPEFRKLEAKARLRARKELRRLLPEIDIIHSHGFDLKEFRLKKLLVS